jgi:HD-like signal output (HDOD) protein
MLPSKVQAIIETVDKLHPIPSNVTRILKEIDNPYITISIIADYIGLDQALTALVIQMANSVAMGYSRNCSTLHDAVMRIGLQRIKSILLASAAMGASSHRLNGYRLGSGELWNHALATAVASDKLAGIFRYPKREEAYVSGMLHDIGKLLLDQFVLTDYSKILEYVQHYHMPLWEVEEKLIGIDHGRVGGLMGERWGYPAELIDAIRFHHYPSLSHGNPTLPAIVNLANSLVSRQNGGSTDLNSNDIHPETFRILRLSPDDLEKINQKLVDAMAC